MTNHTIKRASTRGMAIGAIRLTVFGALSAYNALRIGAMAAKTYQARRTRSSRSGLCSKLMSANICFSFNLNGRILDAEAIVKGCAHVGKQRRGWCGGRRADMD